MLAGHKEKIILRKTTAVVVQLWNREVVTRPSLGTPHTQQDRDLSDLALALPPAPHGARVGL